MEFCILLLYTPEQQNQGSIFAGYQVVMRGDNTSTRSLKLFKKRDIGYNKEHCTNTGTMQCQHT